MKNIYALFILLLVSSFLPLNGQLTPQEAIVGMGRGINLGNTLEPPTESAWNNGPAQESYFDAYVEAGFGNVRIPVRWDQHTGNTAPYSINESWMNRVEQVVDWGLERGFYITLNGHHEDWLKNNYNNANLRARYDSIWVQVAERFKNKSEKLLFEIINEPKGMTANQVDDLNNRILGIIRSSNPTRIVIYGGNEWANSAQLLNAAIPDDPYLIGYYHSYDPWNFSGLGMGTWGSPNDYQQMNNQYKSVKNWSVANSIPVHHSEFGALLSCDFNSRMRIYAHNIEQCLVNGFAFSAWDDGGDFRILNRNNNKWPEVKDILIHYYEDSPNEIFSTFSPDMISGEPTIVVDWNNRANGNGEYILERSIGASSSFEAIAALPSGTESYIDLDVEAGKTYTYRMYTARSDGTLIYGYPTRVRIIATNQSPYNDLPITIPGILEVEEYDNGGEGLAYHDSEPANIPAGFRLDEGVDIGSYDNGFILEYVASGEWIEYTVDVAQAGTYDVRADVASEFANGSFTLSFDQNNSSTSFNIPDTDDWYAFKEIKASNDIVLEAGTQNMRLNIRNNNPFNLDKLTFTLLTVDVSYVDPVRKDFKVSPNPTNSVINIELSGVQLSESPKLKLFGSNGQHIATFLIEGNAQSIDLSDLANGLYFLQLVDNKSSLVQRILLE